MKNRKLKNGKIVPRMIQLIASMYWRISADTSIWVLLESITNTKMKGFCFLFFESSSAGPSLSLIVTNLSNKTILSENFSLPPDFLTGSKRIGWKNGFIILTFVWYRSTIWKNVSTRTMITKDMSKPILELISFLVTIHGV